MAGKALLAVQYERQYAEAIDKDYKFTTAERTAYLTNARRYAGQIVLDSTLDKLYKLSLDKTTWIELVEFNPIAANEYGTHPQLNTFQEFIEYILGGSPNITPTAPTSGVVNDTDNTFNFTEATY